MKDKVYFKTFSVNLAATLYTLGFPIDGIYTNPSNNRVEFYFAETAEMKKTTQDYFDRKLRMEPQTLLFNRSEILWKINHDTNIKKSA